MHQVSLTPKKSLKRSLKTPKSAGSPTKPESNPTELPSESVSLQGTAGVSQARLRADSQQTEKTALRTALSSMPPTVSVPVGKSFEEGFVTGYLTPKEIRSRCEALQKQYPDLIEIVDTGIMTHGYDGSKAELKGSSELFYLRLGPQTEDRDKKVGVFQFKAPHARERVPAMAMMELTEQLVKNYDPSSQDPEVKANTALMDDLDIFVAINTNPDGSNFVINDDRMWRKNRAPIEGSTQKGVDINRNYPYQWERSTRPGSQTYSGKGPASEPETQGILKVVQDHPNIMFVVDWHSYGEEIRRPMGVSKADDAFYNEMHGRVQKAIKDSHGNEYDTVVSQVTKGSSDDHFYHVENAYSTVMETAKTFIPSEDEALVVMEESVAGAREFLQVAADYQKEL